MRDFIGKTTSANFSAFVLAPYIFTKLLKVLVAFLRRLGTVTINYLDNMLIIEESVKETLNFRDSVILLLQKFDFVINQEKSVTILTQLIEFLGMEIDSKTMTILLQQESSEVETEMPESISDSSCIHFRINKKSWVI